MLSAIPSASLRAGTTAVTRGQCDGTGGRTSTRSRHSQKPPRAQIKYNQMARANAAIAVRTMRCTGQNSPPDPDCAKLELCQTWAPKDLGRGSTNVPVFGPQVQRNRTTTEP